MKKCINLIAISCLLLLHTATAQDDQESTAPATPRWVSEKGYWIVESNVNTPKQYTVRFYNNDHVVVYTEKIQGVVLRLNRRKVKMNLKRVLETAILAWEKQPRAKENQGWVASALHQ
ncbi:hypothetical protein HB364_04805 [Pseudoflavitalea sp. X16]|uniref:hypothetical protein n=1 Tax=Paraflavitalea devenefica TaxID=2716334 RepID=UPI0014247B5F|nr:hypothetical protein [Paraflavitalea devenefica]NII24383.1 hypothetical protein [Paraflavitalea devenefica]